MIWTEDDQANLRAWRAETPPVFYREIARRMGRSFSSVREAAKRYVLGHPSAGGWRWQQDRRAREAAGQVLPLRWSEDVLTERYADRKKRRQGPPGPPPGRQASDASGPRG